MQGNKNNVSERFNVPHSKEKEKNETKKHIIATIKKTYLKVKFGALGHNQRFQSMYELLDQWNVELFYYRKFGKYKSSFESIDERLKWFYDIPKNYSKKRPSGIIIDYPVLEMNKKLSEIYGYLDKLTQEFDLA